MIKLEKLSVYKVGAILFLLFFICTAFAYETGEFEAPVELSNGQVLYEGSVYNFDKQHDNYDTNRDGKVDTNLTQYRNSDGQRIKKESLLIVSHMQEKFGNGLLLTVILTNIVKKTII